MRLAGMNTSVQQHLSDSVVRRAVYLAAAWKEPTRHEFGAHGVEETQVDWQGTRYVLGESGYYLPDSTRASWSMDKYTQGKEEVAAAYEWFLRLPLVVPLSMLWVAGAALMGTCALVLYWVGWVLTGLSTGSI